MPNKSEIHEAHEALSLLPRFRWHYIQQDNKCTLFSDFLLCLTEESHTYCALAHENFTFTLFVEFPYFKVKSFYSESKYVAFSAWKRNVGAKRHKGPIFKYSTSTIRLKFSKEFISHLCTSIKGRLSKVPNTQQFPLWHVWPGFLKSWASDILSCFENLDSVVGPERSGKFWPYFLGPPCFSVCICKMGIITSHFTRHNSLMFVKCFQILGYWVLYMYNFFKELKVNLHGQSSLVEFK